MGEKTNLSRKSYPLQVGILFLFLGSLSLFAFLVIANRGNIILGAVFSIPAYLFLLIGFILSTRPRKKNFQGKDEEIRIKPRFPENPDLDADLNQYIRPFDPKIACKSIRDIIIYELFFFELRGNKAKVQNILQVFHKNKKSQILKEILNMQNEDIIKLPIFIKHESEIESSMSISLKSMSISYE
ncbi:MAG: hypothetical protein ACETWK_08855 [Candidatus Aminicenantaceae bacterium]